MKSETFWVFVPKLANFPIIYKTTFNLTKVLMKSLRYKRFHLKLNKKQEFILNQPAFLWARECNAKAHFWVKVIVQLSIKHLNGRMPEGGKLQEEMQKLKGIILLPRFVFDTKKARGWDEKNYLEITANFHRDENVHKHNKSHQCEFVCVCLTKIFD